MARYLFSTLGSPIRLCFVILVCFIPISAHAENDVRQDMVPEWAKVSKEQIEYARKTGLPVAKEIDIGHGVTMGFVLIPPGEFMMGAAPPRKGVAQLTGKEAELARALDKKVTLQGMRVTLDDFVAFIRKELPSSVTIDDGIKSDGIPPATLELRGVPLKAVLKLFLASRGLDYSTANGALRLTVRGHKPAVGADDTPSALRVTAIMPEEMKTFVIDHQGEEDTPHSWIQFGSALTGFSYIFVDPKHDPATYKAFRFAGKERIPVPEVVEKSIKFMGYQYGVVNDILLIGTKEQIQTTAQSLTFTGVDIIHSNELPRHRVTISTPFYLSIHETTVQQTSMVEFGPKTVPGEPKGTPSMNRSWRRVQEFCNTLSQRKFPERFRLPTEAEWEYACRAGTTSVYYFGDSPGELPTHARYGQYVRNSAAVGSKKPNPWGIYDMLGNLAEWCADWYSIDYFAQSSPKDPRGPEKGEMRVVRGGKYDDWHPSDLTCAVRAGKLPGYEQPDVGFRIVLDVMPPRSNRE